MEQSLFNRLSEDDVLEMLNYMPINERIKFEHISNK